MRDSKPGARQRPLHYVTPQQKIYRSVMFAAEITNEINASVLALHGTETTRKFRMTGSNDTHKTQEFRP
jgi:hypothetical protein